MSPYGELHQHNKYYGKDEWSTIITIDPVSELDYVSARTDYSYNNLSSPVLGMILNFLIIYWILSIRVPLSMFLMGDRPIIDVIRLGPGEQTHDADVPWCATGEYNYYVNYTEGNGKEVHYEDM